MSASSNQVVLVAWFLWLSRVALGPFVDDLPHVGAISQRAISQSVTSSVADALLLFWRKTSPRRRMMKKWA